ncbi:MULTISPECIES: hypothetical protein [Novosphingobium]|jgi:hypothetical protein|uniref:hypothetical protein n=1 Tax=Novosphingobium TaxID=165696 RepID=UPI0022F26435|nr:MULTISPECIES: hypothetical protein [Novosphingobium]GLK44616.1 hypothetical protein GCM10017612_25360 [Novosphingobium resinovorum]
MLVAETSGKAAPPSEGSLRTRMAEAGVSAPEECLPGVLSNLIVLQDHVATLRAFALDPRSASAMRFEA